MSKPNIISDKTAFYKLIYIIAGLIILFLILKAFSASLFVKRKGRINFVVYDKTPIYYSLGQNNTINYGVPFFADLKVVIPGGYSFYRLGALRKLVQLEKKPELFRKTFSSMTSTFTDFYFYPSKTEVYYGGESTNIFILPNFYKLFIYKSNANIFDRLYLFIKLVNMNRGNFNLIEDYDTTKEKSELFFDSRGFLKDYQGYFYQKSYRNEDETVQIIYTKEYEAAQNIGNILDGNGIRVVDISSFDNRPKLEKCLVTEGGERFSQTAKDIAEFFNCQLRQGKTETSDIIFELGSMEKEWEVN